MLYSHYIVITLEIRLLLHISLSLVTVLCRHEAAPAQVEVVGEGGRPEPVHPLAPASTHVRWFMVHVSHYIDTCHTTQPRVSSSHV